jgi:succinyl-CoA:acetate CoA-transferase
VTACRAYTPRDAPAEARPQHQERRKSHAHGSYSPARLRDRIMSPEAAAALFADGMTVGMSGFTRAGDCKAVPFALAERAARAAAITLMTGASLGNDIDKVLTDANVISRRIPFQSDPTLRRKINAGEVMFIDQHLSETVEQLRAGQIAPVDIAVVEATAITENGGIVPTTSVGNSASFAVLAKKIIVEINLTMPPGSKACTTSTSPPTARTACRFR